MEQSERLEILVARFAAESGMLQGVGGDRSPDVKRDALRAMMNVRMPRPLDEETLLIQDAYLAERAVEKGVVTPADIPTLGAGPFEDVLSIWQGDITRLQVGAIVNAANASMLGCFQPLHNCIDNCIHTFAGVQLRLECERQMARKRRLYGEDYEQPTAEPILTPAYNLPAEHVVHIVGPIIYDAVTDEQDRELAACYTNTLDLCASNGIKSVAFCCISTGVFRFPKDRAAHIAVRTVTDWLAAKPGRMERVIFSVHNDGDRARYEDECARLTEEGEDR